jgi:hypothetical protein
MTTQTNNFDDVFKKRVAALEAEAHAVGLNFTSICKEAGISRATPDRWKRETPKTIKIISAMEEIVAKRKAEKLPR